jgi:flavin reductase (DIM6/NTAB) family NADH-FMN oxidoreductase RutF
MGSTVRSLRLAPPPLDPEFPTADEAAIRTAARRIPAGVCVVTTGAGATRAGATATSVSVLSAEPPTVVVCLRRALRAYAVLRATGRMAVNVLGSDQREIAEAFLGADEASSRGAALGWRPLGDDLACLDECAAVLECEAEETVERLDNAIVVGRVRRAIVGAASGALLRFGGVYDQVGWSRDEIARAVGLRA